MARAAGGMFDFSQIQIPANLLAGALLFEIVNEHSIGLKVVRSKLTPAIQEGLEAQAAPAQLLPGPGWVRRILQQSGEHLVIVGSTDIYLNSLSREMLRANPDQMAMLKQNNPKLSEALESGDLEAFAKVFHYADLKRNSVCYWRYEVWLLVRFFNVETYRKSSVQVLKEQQDARKEREQMRIRLKLS